MEGRGRRVEREKWAAATPLSWLAACRGPRMWDQNSLTSFPLATSGNSWQILGLHAHFFLFLDTFPPPL